MESLPSECVSDLNNEEENDSELWRQLIKERESIMSEDNIKLIENRRFLKKDYHTLENVNLNSITDTDPPEMDELIVRHIHDNHFEELSNAVEHGFDDNVELQLSDISSIMTRFTADDYKNRCILELSKRIEGNIAECYSLTNKAKEILAEKMQLHRELNNLNEQIAYHTVEDTKYKRVQKKRGTECAKTGSFRRTYFCRFGIPYFKTKDRFPAEQNEDLKEIIRNGEVMVIRMPPVRRILKQDTRSLDTSVLDQLKNKRIHELQNRLKRLEEPKNDNVDHEQQTQNLLKAIGNARSINDIRDTKDWNIDVDFSALSKLNSRFSVEDYERMWQLLGRPSLSRDEFSQDELSKLKELVHLYGGQNWDQIAEMLNTQRSGFVCFNKWVSLERKGTRKPWTKNEDDLLRKLCDKIDTIKDEANSYHYWRYIRRQFPHRTYTQIHGHWKYKLAPTLKKGRFTESETEKLEHLIREGKSFGEIASIFQTRSSVQLRSHFNQIVERASSNTGAWTQEEEIALFDLIDKYGTNNWVQISKELGTRNRSQCRLKFLQGAWSPYETQQFHDLIEKYGTNFEKISQEIGTKTLAQCRMKFVRQKECEKEGSHNEGRWTKRETRIFRTLFEKYNYNFALISQELKTRSAEQCQEKYERMTQRNVKLPIKNIEVKVLDGEQEDRILKIYQDDTKLTVVNRTSRWTRIEKDRFKELIKEYGSQFDKISLCLGTKSIKQCRNMFQKMGAKTEEISVSEEILVSEEISVTNSSSSGKKTKKSNRPVTKRKRLSSQPDMCPSSAETDECTPQNYEESSHLHSEDPLKDAIEESPPVIRKARPRGRTSKKIQVS